MHPYLEHAVAVLRHLTFALGYALHLIGRLLLSAIHFLRLLLSPILSVLHLIALPAIYVVHFALAVLVFPVNLLRSLETLYVFFGVAALVGVVAGSLLYGTSSVLSSIFGLEATGGGVEKPVRSVAEYRAEKKKRRQKLAAAASTALVNGQGKRKRHDRGLSSPNTILEEVELDF